MAATTAVVGLLRSGLPSVSGCDRFRARRSREPLTPAQRGRRTPLARASGARSAGGQVRSSHQRGRRLAALMTTSAAAATAAQARKMPRLPSTVREPKAMSGPETIDPMRRVFM